MMRKIFGIKSISHLIYGLLMLAPILAIGVKCAYVVINKNAKDSYSEKTVTYNYALQNNNEITTGTKYTLTTKNLDSYPNQMTLRISYLSLTANDLNISNADYDRINFLLVNSQGYIRFSNQSAPTSWIVSIPYENNITFDVIISSLEGNSTTNLDWFYFNQIFIGQNTIDNVFYYAIDEIIQDNNFGKINFTGWFDNMMLDNNIQINQTYIHLFNWYLNYTLFISCAYILWLVLMWFVTFARKLLDRGMNYDW